MNTSINVVCYKWKTLANGENPLMISVCKDGRRKYKSLGVSVNPRYWDFTKNRLKSNCPNRAYLDKVINDKLQSLNGELMRMQLEELEYTVNTLLEEKKPLKTRTVKDLFLQQMQRLEDSGRRNYMLSVKQIYNSLLSFNKHLDIYFSTIDVPWLRKYETWLRKRGVAENTIGIHFRTLRMVYNIAIEENAVKAECYPFKKYKVSKLHQETAKRALSKEDVEQIIHYHATSKMACFAIDIFSFTYYTGGINFMDIAGLTQDNIIDGRLVYRRHKTGKLIKLPLQQQSFEIIQRYQSKDNPYLFPIFSPFHKTEAQKANRLHKVITKVNKHLKQIGEELTIPIPVTTYVARHSQATVMKKAGIPTAVISQIMGHSSERVTQIYLDSFDNEQINEAMKNLL